MKKLLSLVMLLSLLAITQTRAFAKSDTNYEADLIYEDSTSVMTQKINARSCILMDSTTGKVLYAQNEDYRASAASVTKVMTLLLVCEAIKEGRISLTDTVFVSANAASLGGSQVFLKEGESMTVEELIKCTVIASANDAATALAEHTAGSVQAFVEEMNKKGKELKMENTKFENPTGLDDTTVNHYTSSEDIAIMSRELIKHEVILKYSNVWQDTIRNGEFTLTNTNRLVRYYEGCTGLKTGSTDKAGYCVSTTAKRDNLHLIAVIMGAESREERNAAARALLDYGFATYKLLEENEIPLETVPIICGETDSTRIYSKGFSCIVEKSKLKLLEKYYEIPERLNAPVSSDDPIGKVVYKIEGEVIGEASIYAESSVRKLSFFGLYMRMLAKALFS